MVVGCSMFEWSFCLCVRFKFWDDFWGMCFFFCFYDVGLEWDFCIVGRMLNVLFEVVGV